MYYGESQCQSVKADKQPCQNKAYYSLTTGQLVCGVHSKAGNRNELPRNPNKRVDDQMFKDKLFELAHSQAAANKSQGVRGSVLNRQIFR
jgi:hypothetical protein